MHKIVLTSLVLGTTVLGGYDQREMPSEAGVKGGGYTHICRLTDKTVGIVLPKKDQNLAVVGENLTLDEVAAIKRIEHEMVIDMIAMEVWQSYPLMLFNIDEGNIAFEELKDIDFGDQSKDKPAEDRESKEDSGFTFISLAGGEEGQSTAMQKVVPLPEELIAMNDMTPGKSAVSMLSEVRDLLLNSEESKQRRLPVKEVFLYNSAGQHENQKWYDEDLVGDGKDLVDLDLAEYFVEKKWEEVESKRYSESTASEQVVKGIIFSKNMRKRVEPPLYIGSEVVTNEQYALFLSATGYPAPVHWIGGQIPKGLDKQPVTNISLEDIKAYEAWFERNKQGSPTGILGVNVQSLSGLGSRISH